jgi:hypothetical protein
MLEEVKSTTVTTKEILKNYIRENTSEIEDAVDDGNISSSDARATANVAFAMLGLGRVDEAKKWFTQSVIAKEESVIAVKEGKLKLAKEQGREIDINDLGWREFHNLAILVSLTGNKQMMSDLGETLYKHATDPALGEVNTESNELDSTTSQHMAHYICSRAM